MKIKLNHPVMDASENAFFSRQLEHIRAGVFEVQYPEFKARMFLPINNSIDPGAEEYTYQWFDKVGKADVTRDYAMDAPGVNVFAGEVTSKLYGIRASYTYSVQEARAARLAGTGLVDRKARAARHAVEQKLDEILLLGDSQLGLEGLFDLSNTETYTVPDPGSGTEFENKTPDQVVADLCGASDQVVNSSNGVEQPDTIILPLSSYNYVACTRMADGTDTTILNYFLGVSPFVSQVLWSEKLESNAAWTGKRMLAYRRSPDKLEGLIPQEFEQMAPEMRGMAFRTETHARCGGVAAYFPKSIAYGDGI